jgi:pimeloyl-ACP methyl ester carboxylesterase
MALACMPSIAHKHNIHVEEKAMFRIFSSIALAFTLSLPVAAEEVTITHQGLKLKANLELADGKSLKDGVILMTHGTLAHGRMEIMSTLQENMKARGYNSLSINLSYGVDNRPFAMHECTAPQVHRHEDSVGEIAAWAAWLKSKGVSKIVVLGHSRGGNQTAWYASEKPDAAVKAVVLIAPGSWTEQYLAEDYQKRFGTSLAPVLDNARKQIKAGKGKEKIAKANVVYCKDTQTTAEALVSYHGFDPHLATFDLLKKMSMTVLVIAGSDDETTPGVAEKAKPHSDGKKVQLVSIDGADHFFRDLYAEEAVDAINAFLKGQGF